MSDLSQSLIDAAEKAIDGHHRAHLGEAQDADVADRECTEQFGDRPADEETT